MLSGSFGCLAKLGTKQDELVQMFVPRSRIRIFRNERTRSTPLDLKLPSFGSLTKLGAKRAELVQKFMPRSCVRIFRNERTRFTPFFPKLTFWCISHQGASRTAWLSYETHFKTGRTSAKFRATKSHRNVSQRTHPIYPHWTLN